MIPRRLIPRLVPLLLLVPAGASATYLQHDGVRGFIEEVSQREGFNAAELRGLLEGVRRQDRVLERIARPAEALPWKRYRPIFVTEARARAGAEFVREHRELLERAQARYGVAPEIVTAILGVETFYGRHEGGFPVLDTLVTLAFDYPPRSRFFRSELEQFLLLAREERVDPRTAVGSYAGAMGMPQFISSSYREYAVDFDGDGQRDLWSSRADVVGSVAAYLSRHGWQAGRPIADRLRPSDDRYRDLLDRGLKPSLGERDLRTRGLEVDPPLADGERVMLVELEGSEGPELWAGRRNFYAITRYNHSPLYALAVYQLSRDIHARLEDR
ncbi:MAG: lytic murein transglycosylase B [Halofilum sp. (in: g-proteobacteria)]|nr:lytic murein transglycosylase B [Halofilum sp. (in: g-proteobacteria)]